VTDDNDDSVGGSTEVKRSAQLTTSPYRHNDGSTNQGGSRAASPLVPALELLASPQRGKLRPKSASSRRKTSTKDNPTVWFLFFIN
jgi:hypothetical protein